MKNKIAEYYDAQYTALYGIACSRVDNPSDAQEVLSEAVISLLRQVDTGSLVNEEDIPRFFTTCINSRAIDFKRKTDRQGVVDQDLESGLILEQQYDEAPNPEESLQEEQEKELLNRIIEGVVNKNKRTILTKAILYGMKPSSISAEVGLSPQYINRVLREFEKEYVEIL